MATVSGKKIKWNEDETKILLQIWSECRESLKKKRNKAVWDTITEDLNDICKDLDGFTARNASQVKTKMKNLLDAYKDAKTKNSKTGNNRETSPFYDIIDEVIGTREGTCPTHVVEVTDITNEVDNTAADCHTVPVQESESEPEVVDANGDKKDKSKKRKRGDKEKANKISRNEDALQVFLEESNKHDCEMMELMLKREKEMQEAEHSLMRDFMGSLGELLRK